MEIKIKLFDAKEELPKRSGEYLCLVDTYWATLPYSTKHKRFNVYNDDTGPKYAIDVLFWAELPELYKQDPMKPKDTKRAIDQLIGDIQDNEVK